MNTKNNTGLLAVCFCATFVYLFSVSSAWADPDILKEQARDLGQVKELTRKWLDAYQSGDIETLMSFYTDETVIYLGDKASMHGLKEIRAYFEPRLGASKFDVIVKDEEFLVHGDLIIHFSLVWISGHITDSNQPFSDAIQSIIMFRLSPDSGWKIYRDMDQHTKDTDRPIDK